MPDVYTGAHHYRITYSSTEWRVEMPGKRSNPRSPDLVHLSIAGCRLYLREGAVDVAAGTTTREVTLAGYTWGVYNVGETYPNHDVYTLGQPDKGIAFIIGLDWSLDAPAATQQACRHAAEAVLDTVFVLD